MKKFLLSFFVIFVFIVYAFHQRKEDSQAILAVKKPQLSPAVPSTTPTPSSSGAFPTPTSAPTIIPQGQYKNGVYIGSEADAFYGIVQVQVYVSNGKISDVQFLQYPNDRGTSIEINSQAMPYLKQEALQAQSAAVDIVSGATQTSQAFIESLKSALDKAKV